MENTKIEVKKEVKDGMSLKEASQNYEKKTFKDISDLKKISVDISIKLDGDGVKKDGSKFNYWYFMDEEDEIRLPKTVLEQVNVQCEANPKLKFFRVVKTGEGINTAYTVIPLSE